MVTVEGPVVVRGRLGGDGSGDGGGAVTVAGGGAVTVAGGGTVTVGVGAVTVVGGSTVTVCAGTVTGGGAAGLGSELPFCPPNSVVLRSSPAADEPAMSSGSVKTSTHAMNPRTPVTAAWTHRTCSGWGER